MKHLTEREHQHELESAACNDREAARRIVRRVEHILAKNFQGIQAHLIGSVSVNGHGSDVDILIGPAPGEEEWFVKDMLAAMAVLAKEFGMASVSKDYGQAGASQMLNFILVSRGVERWLKADDLLRFLASTGQGGGFRLTALPPSGSQGSAVLHLSVETKL